ncbi:MAG: 5'-methylthioadenosine/adenosylhomocysteine nucleosidase [Candidatus Faecimonas sp.]|nr:5'-methylthioadenosine/adenosylhomocysteine nucleosidase [Mycoplasmatota bacterium]MDY2908025.1 5'-methylthioadenosine/adenosylhomocysteine nucleosidase [Candidatus Faecimonas sp.]
MIIGIIGAFDEEVEKFIETFQLKEEEDSIWNIYLGEYKGKQLVVCRSGIGKVNSGAMTQYLIDHFHVDLIINSGCAGSLLSKVKIMDVILSNYVTYHDFQPTRVMEYSVPEQGKVTASTKLIHVAEEALAKIEVKNYYIAPIASGDCFVTDANMRDRIYTATGAYAVDMESASIGHICKLNRIPFLAVRTISDFSDGQEDFEVIAAYKSSQLVKTMIEIL